MDSNLLETDINDILQSVLTQASDDLLLVDPTEEAIRALVDVATAFDGELPTIRMLAEERPIKETMEDFLVASRAADLIDTGGLSIRVLSDPAANSLLISGDSVLALVSAGDRIAALTTDDSAFVDSARESYDEQWDAAETYRLRTPPISRVRETLADDISEAARDDFDAVLAELDTARGDGEGLDEVTISLLVAAKKRGPAVRHLEVGRRRRDRQQGNVLAHQNATRRYGADRDRKSPDRCRSTTAPTPARRRPTPRGRRQRARGRQSRAPGLIRPRLLPVAHRRVLLLATERITHGTRSRWQRSRCRGAYSRL